MSGFQPSYAGLGELLASEEMQAAMHDKADKIAEAARAIAPVGPATDPHRELYKDSFSVESGVRESPTRRAYARVKNEVPYAASIEYGNSQGSPAQHILGNAIDAAKD